LPVSAAAPLARLLALYQAGYLPDSPGLHDQAAALGWHGCTRLDALFARWPLSVVALPDSTRLAWLNIEARVDWGRVRAVRIGGPSSPRAATDSPGGAARPWPNLALRAIQPRNRRSRLMCRRSSRRSQRCLYAAAGQI